MTTFATESIKHIDQALTQVQKKDQKVKFLFRKAKACLMIPSLIPEANSILQGLDATDAIEIK
jgi:hypothetical protein